MPLDDLEVELRLARGWQSRGRVERAMGGYGKILAASPSHAAARLALGDLLLEHGRWTEAIEVFEAGVHLTPTEAVLQNGLVRALVAAGGVEQASQYHGLVRRDTTCLATHPDQVLLVSVVRNESIRLPFLLDYHRRLGVSRFLVVDNGSTDGSVDWLLQQPDVHVWTTSHSFNGANFGSAWFEVLLRQAAVHRWCVMVDADEFFFYPECETMALPQLCQALEQLGKRAMNACFLDIYSDRPVRETHYQAGDNILQLCPWFDREFHHAAQPAAGPYRNQTCYVGGVRSRVFGSEVEFFLSKVPLLLYRTDVILAGGQHWTNLAAPLMAATTGAVLHAKYVSTFPDSVVEQAARAEHYDDAVQYKYYEQRLDRDPDLTLFDPRQSVRLTNSAHLVDLGVMVRGQLPAGPEFPSIPPLADPTSRPAWSVVVTTYDRTAYVERALRTVLEQASPDMEILVVNDGGHPTVQDTVRNLAAGLGVAFHAWPDRLGQAQCFNEGIRLARGEWIHLLSDDDWVEPTFYRALAQAGEVGAAFCRQHYSTPSGETRRLSVLERDTPGTLPDWLDRIGTFCRLQSVGMVVRRSVYETVGGFCPQAGSAFDWEMWQRIARHFPVWYDPAPLAHFCEHDDSLSSGLIRSGSQVADALAAIRVASTYMPASLSHQARRRYAEYGVALARRLRDEGDWQAAWVNLHAARRLDPGANLDG